ncbi:MAG TPA: DUF308 domain-containing protein [Terriglobia bacterium]|nr:DUF308 domain-containing protein [Terriglobia bacterium]
MIPSFISIRAVELLMAVHVQFHARGVSMDVILVMNWWLLLMRGVAALLLGILVVTLHNLSLHELALVFFGYAMIDGAANLAGAITAAQKREPWGLLLLEAMVGFVAGLLTVTWPGLPMMGLIYIISGWGLATGALGMISPGLRSHFRGKWLLALSGAASIALGMVMAAMPLAGPSAIQFWLGVYAFVFGILLVALAFRVRALVETRRQRESKHAA